MSDKDKADRLAAQLRENLRRRKAQSRAMTDGQAPKTPAMPGQKDKGG